MRTGIYNSFTHFIDYLLITQLHRRNFLQELLQDIPDEIENFSLTWVERQAQATERWDAVRPALMIDILEAERTECSSASTNK